MFCEPEGEGERRAAENVCQGPAGRGELHSHYPDHLQLGVVDQTQAAVLTTLYRRKATHCGTMWGLFVYQAD